VSGTNVAPKALPFRLEPVASQTVEAGKTLTVTATVKNAEAWNGKLQYFLAPNAPVGSTISAETGVFTWTPPEDQGDGKHDVTVLVQGPDGQTAQTTFVVTVTRPTPPLEKELAFDLGNGVKMEMVLIPAGEFLMGSPDSDKDALPAEKPQHRVRITKPFYLGRYPVTQEQWQAVMGNNPSRFNGATNPVTNTRWDDCQVFVQKLNGKLTPGRTLFQLPTEAQWEYACHAGNATKYGSGDSEKRLAEYAWFGHSGTHPVGQKKPNAWGLYDMHGNAWEWCSDWFDDSYYKKSPSDDPPGPSSGASHALRGGGWGNDRLSFRVNQRCNIRPPYHNRGSGMRLARIVDGEAVVSVQATARSSE
jgi:formylglycine-generating enzyme required for sulfatase activity